MESICLSSGFMYSFTGIWICDSGKAGSDFFSSLEMVVAVVLGPAQPTQQIANNITSTADKNLMNLRGIRL